MSRVLRISSQISIACCALAFVATCAPSALTGSAPPDEDIVEPDLYNVFLREEASAAGATMAEIEAAGRTLELVFRRPVDLTTLSLVLADGDISIADSRFVGSQDIRNYIDSFAFARTKFQSLPGEGNCETTPGSDRTCDTLLLEIREGELTDGTDITVQVFGAEIDVYVLDTDGSVTTDTEPLDGNAVIDISVRTPAADAPELESYTLRLPGEGGEFEGLLEPGVCTLCSGPEVEFYFPPHGRVHGRFNTVPARFSMSFESGEVAFVDPVLGRLTSLAILDTSLALLDDMGADFEPGADGEFDFGPVASLSDSTPIAWEPGLKIDAFEIVSDDLFRVLGTPGRFLLRAPTQSATGTAFVQTIGTAGTDPTSDIATFTIAHVRIESPADTAAITSVVGAPVADPL